MQNTYDSEKKSPIELFRISLIRQYEQDGASIFKLNPGNICTSFSWSYIQNEEGGNLILSLFENSVSLEGRQILYLTLDLSFAAFTLA